LTDVKTASPAVMTVKKIRKFRLHARPSAVLRNLKALLDEAQITPELEKAVEAEILAAGSRLETAALFETGGPPWMGPSFSKIPWRHPFRRYRGERN
jgi:hypothetical protein